MTQLIILGRLWLDGVTVNSLTLWSEIRVIVLVAWMKFGGTLPILKYGGRVIISKVLY